MLCAKFEKRFARMVQDATGLSRGTSRLPLPYIGPSYQCSDERDIPRDKPVASYAKPNSKRPLELVPAAFSNNLGPYGLETKLDPDPVVIG